jgi:hypothetical protein
MMMLPHTEHSVLPRSTIATTSPKKRKASNYLIIWWALDNYAGR